MALAPPLTPRDGSVFVEEELNASLTLDRTEAVVAPILGGGTDGLPPRIELMGVTGASPRSETESEVYAAVGIGTWGAASGAESPVMEEDLFAAAGVQTLGATAESISPLNDTFAGTEISHYDEEAKNYCLKITTRGIPHMPPSGNDFVTARKVFAVTLDYSPPLSEHMEVTVTTEVNHTYGQGNAIIISGVTGPGAAWFNGIFAIDEPPGAATFKYHLTASGAPPAGPSASDAIDCRLAAAEFGVRLFWPVAKVTTGSDHGCEDYDVVRLNSTDSLFNGDFVITGKTANTFYFRLTTMPADDAKLTGLTCAKLTFRFDHVMRALQEDQELESCVVHLGPGTFETRGLCPGYAFPYRQFAGYQVKSGQRLLGAGIGVTTLKLVHAVDSYSQTLAVASHSQVSGFEASDFTVDCNLGGQPVPAGLKFAPVTCGAVAVGDQFIRLRRLRATHFGAQAQVECFVLACFAHYSNPAGPLNNVIEECIVDQPSENNIQVTSLIACTGDHVRANNRAGVVRRCFANCEYGNGASPEFLQIASMVNASNAAGYFAKVTTKRPHHRVVGNHVLIQAVSPPEYKLDGSYRIEALTEYDTEFIVRLAAPFPTAAPNVDRAFIGVSFQGPAAAGGTGCVTEGNVVHDCIRSYYNDTGVTRDMVLRYNYYSNVQHGMVIDFNPDAGGTDGFWPAESLTSEGIYATFLTKDGRPHRLSDGQVVSVRNALPKASPYNGDFPVTVVNDTKFQYTMASDPQGQATGQPEYAARWQTKRFVIEDNVFDHYLTDNNSFTSPRSVSTHGLHEASVFMFPNMVIRGNIMRHSDNATGDYWNPDGPAFGVDLVNADRVLVEKNLVDLDHANLIQHIYSGAIHCFANRTAAGKPIIGYDWLTHRRDDEFRVRMDDALLMAI